MTTPAPAHTPGPWFLATGNPATAVLCGGTDDPEIICECELSDPMSVANRITGTDYSMIEANARLIAAAPELIAVCQSWIDYLDSDVSEAEARLLEITRAALAKARGES